MAYVYMCTHSCVVRVTAFRTGRKFRPVSNFMELHTLTQDACSYAVLPSVLPQKINNFQLKGKTGG